MILFAMVCGFMPFESATNNVPHLFKRIARRQFKMPDYISKGARRALLPALVAHEFRVSYAIASLTECQDLLDRMLTVDPDKRCTISELRNHPWFVCWAAGNVAKPRVVCRFLMEFTELVETIEKLPPGLCGRLLLVC